IRVEASTVPLRPMQFLKRFRSRPRLPDASLARAVSFSGSRTARKLPFSGSHRLQKHRLQAPSLNVHDAAGALKLSFGKEKRRPKNLPPKARKELGWNDDVGHAGLVFQRKKAHALGGGRTLAANDHPSHAHEFPWRCT